MTDQIENAGNGGGQQGRVGGQGAARGLLDPGCPAGRIRPERA